MARCTFILLCLLNASSIQARRLGETGNSQQATVSRHEQNQATMPGYKASPLLYKFTVSCSLRSNESVRFSDEGGFILMVDRQTEGKSIWERINVGIYSKKDSLELTATMRWPLSLHDQFNEEGDTMPGIIKKFDQDVALAKGQEFLITQAETNFEKTCLLPVKAAVGEYCIGKLRHWSLREATESFDVESKVEVE